MSLEAMVEKPSPCVTTLRRLEPHRGSSTPHLAHMATPRPHGPPEGLTAPLGGFQDRGRGGLAAGDVQGGFGGVRGSRICGVYYKFVLARFLRLEVAGYVSCDTNSFWRNLGSEDGRK